MFYKYVHKDDIEKVLKEKELILFALEDDFERPALGISETAVYAPGELTYEMACSVLKEKYNTLPESEAGIYYSTMLGFWDKAESPKYLVYMMTYSSFEHDKGDDPVTYDNDVCDKEDFFTGKPMRYTV